LPCIQQFLVSTLELAYLFGGELHSSHVSSHLETPATHLFNHLILG
jgi:hypothetical protein